MSRLFAYITLLLLLSVSILRGQDVVPLDFYPTNWQVLNPAITDKMYIINREQSSKSLNLYTRIPNFGYVEGAPRTYGASFDCYDDTEVDGGNRSKCGISILSDSSGGFNRLNITGNYTYRINFGSIEKPKSLYMGLNTSIFTYKYTPRGTVAMNDPLAQAYAAKPRLWAMQVTPGIFYLAKTNTIDNWYLGLSSPQILNTYLQKPDSLKSSLSKYFQNINFMGGVYQYNDKRETFFKQNFSWELSGMVQYQNQLYYQSWNKFISGQINYRVYIRTDDQTTDTQIVWGGIGLHSAGSGSLEVGIVQPIRDNTLRLGFLCNSLMFNKKQRVNSSWLNTWEFQATLTW